MATAIAYSFMQDGENGRAREEDKRRQRRHTEYHYNQRPLTNRSFDGTGSGSCSSSPALHRGMKRRPKEDISKLENPRVRLSYYLYIIKVSVSFKYLFL
ncbi:hypothetical protein ACJMK2_014111 [Sinanodonta woodiana]|uniref:Uncharacterized protein n=1 Tax=Sinanodonta woodiana TaxID=1069815 RepID=A0ABD3V2W6_SINWO